MITELMTWAALTLRFYLGWRSGSNESLRSAWESLSLSSFVARSVGMTVHPRKCIMVSHAAHIWKCVPVPWLGHPWKLLVEWFALVRQEGAIRPRRVPG